MRWTPKRSVVIGLVIVACGAVSLGGISVGPRGVVLGWLVPSACVAAIAALTDLLWGVVGAALAALPGLATAYRLDGNNESSVDAVINVLPLVLLPLLCLAAAGGALARLAAESLLDLARGRRSSRARLNDR